MATARTICTRALRRLGVLDALHTPSAEDASETLAAFNGMVAEWAGRGVDVLRQSEYTLDSEIKFWVPPIAASAEALALLSYRGTWNASTNSPTLASATGTAGYVYKISDAGSTTLDDVTSWSANDYAFFDGEEWLKGIDSARFESGIIAMLAMRVADEFGMQPPATVITDARGCWSTMLPYYCKPPLARFDSTLIDIPSRENVSFYGEDLS